DESYIGPAVDVWALGVMLFFILTADMPFKANTVAGLKRHILEGAFIIPPFVSTSANDLISHLLIQSPQGRLTTAQMSRHNWLSTAPAPPPPLPSWVTTVPQPEEQTVPEVEKSLKLLESWGISRETIEDGTALGARSPALATYRILSHRVCQNKEDSQRSTTSNSVSPVPTTSPAESPPTSKNVSPRKLKLSKLRNGHTLGPSKNNGMNKSKTCVIV
ncbi:unnamed protein product, partial [Meganyctiphanes norvegica]